MKKLFLILLLASVAAGFAAAQDIDLGDFPLGKWLDEKYDAVWSFSSGNIELYAADGTLIYSFAGKVENYESSAGMDGLEITFSCEETGRSYKFVKGVTNLNLELTVDNVTGTHHEAEMEPTELLDGLLM